MYSVPPDFILFALICSFSFGATVFVIFFLMYFFFFTFKHFVRLLFYIRLIAWWLCIFIRFVN